MTAAPTPEEVRALIAPFDARDRKVLGGVVALLMSEPGRVRDLEWLNERFVQVATFAHGFDQEAGGGGYAPPPDTGEDAVAMVRGYAEQRRRPILNAAIALFVRTAEELKSGAAPPSMEAAQKIVSGYLDA